MRNRRCIAILEVMWDWEARTSLAGYVETAPRWYAINPENHTGKRLYRWLDPDPNKPPEWMLQVTNVCPDLVSNARQRGTPDREWLSENLGELQSNRPADLILVCGKVAQRTVNLRDTIGSRVIFLPHPAARCWTRQGLSRASRHIREGTTNLMMNYSHGRLRVETLVPF